MRAIANRAPPCVRSASPAVSLPESGSTQGPPDGLDEFLGFSGPVCLGQAGATTEIPPPSNPKCSACGLSFSQLQLRQERIGEKRSAQSLANPPIIEQQLADCANYTEDEKHRHGDKRDNVHGVSHSLRLCARHDQPRTKRNRLDAVSIVASSATRMSSRPYRGSYLSVARPSARLVTAANNHCCRRDIHTDHC